MVFYYDLTPRGASRDGESTSRCVPYKQVDAFMLKGLKEKYLVRDDDDPEEVIAKRAGITATVETRGIVRRGMTCRT